MAFKGRKINIHHTIIHILSASHSAQDFLKVNKDIETQISIHYEINFKIQATYLNLT